MPVLFTNFVDGIRQPEYTGENRCIPCTVINIVIAVILTGAIVPLSIPLAGMTLLLSLAVICLRGYLVPGTPALTRRYLPDSVLRRFDHHLPEATLSEGEINVEILLKSANAVTDCQGGDDLCLAPSFQRAWRNRIIELKTEGTTREKLSALINVDAQQLAFDEHGEAFTATVDGHWVGQWESKAALIADLAGFQELDNRYPRWFDLTVEDQSRILNGLRIFLEECPVCDGPVSVNQDTVQSCCRSIDVLAFTCDQCNSRLFERAQPSGKM